MTKRERTVFGSHAHLAHVWAQNDVAHGYSGDRRMMFTGPTIYSYGTHFPIARFVKRKGPWCVLFTSRGYSPSTGKHKTIVRSALHGTGYPVFTVDDVMRLPRESDIRAAQEVLNKDVENFGRCTPYTVEGAVNDFHVRANTANELAEFFGLKRRVTVPAISADVLAKVEARIAKREERQRLMVEARTAARKANDEKTLAKFLAGGNHYLYDQEYGLAATLTELQRNAHMVAWQSIQADKEAAWRAGKPATFDYDEGPTMLRVSGDQVQTSRGAEFPVTHARLAFPIIMECRNSGVGWEKNGHSIRLGNFVIDRIETNGDVRAGCHLVRWSEIEQIAKELELIP